MPVINTEPGTIAVLVVTDGRHDYLKACVESLLANVRGNITEWWMYDDTGDAGHRHQLLYDYPADDGPQPGRPGLLQSLDLAIVDLKYRVRAASAEHHQMRLADSVRDQMRADARRELSGAGMDADPVSVDQAVQRIFDVRHVTPVWVVDGQPVDAELPLHSRVGWRHINAGPRQGFAGAIRHAWRHLLGASNAEWVFHVEQDFVFRRRINLGAMANVLDANPQLAQMALCRQAWNEAEHAAGGVVETNPNAYIQCADPHGNAWLEHRLFWTTNPSLFRLDTCAMPWPSGAHSEGRFTHQLLNAGTPRAKPERVRFGYWGEYNRDGRHVLVEHIGKERTGHGY